MKTYRTLGISLLCLYAALTALTVTDHFVSGAIYKNPHISDIIFPFGIFLIGTLIQIPLYFLKYNRVIIGGLSAVKFLLTFISEYILDFMNIQACAIRGDYSYMWNMIGFLILCILIFYNRDNFPYINVKTKK